VLTVLLIRHASFAGIGERIAGRAAGTRLNQRGREQAEQLGQALAHANSQNGLLRAPIAAVYSGPLERARETADILARSLGVPVQEAPGLDELDFGEWTGKALGELDADPRWRAFNTARSLTRIPGGELMSEAADRAVAELMRLERRHPDGVVCAVSHGDVIRGVLLRCLRMSMDEVHRLEVLPASVSVVDMAMGELRRALAINWTPDL
jgi:probable phosphoglycerate mutase